MASAASADVEPIVMIPELRATTEEGVYRVVAMRLNRVVSPKLDSRRQRIFSRCVLRPLAGRCYCYRPMICGTSLG